MKTLLSIIIFMLLTVPAQAKCDPAYAPYYMRYDVGPGSILADIFFLPFATVIATAGAPAEIARPKRRNRVSTRGGAELTHGPGCMVYFLAKHAAQQRPVRVEPHVKKNWE